MYTLIDVKNVRVGSALLQDVVKWIREDDTLGWDNHRIHMADR
jgi:hypothetical protein